MTIRPFFRFLLVVFLVLGVFYPSLFAEPLSLDDTNQLLAVFHMTWGDVPGLFFSRGGLYYYRPLVILSFFLNDQFWGLSYPFLHLGNILFHLGTGVLMWLLLRRLISDRNSWLPELTSLFFLLHPLVTEPVNWISGRTDLLAGLFVAAAFFVAHADEFKARHGRGFGLGFCLLLGGMAKETALMAVFVLFVSAFWPGSPFYESWRAHRRSLCFWLASAVGVYLMLRTGGSLVRDAGLVSAVAGAHDAAQISLFNKLAGAVRALGFYSRKLVWPFPLNLAIVEIQRNICFIFGLIAAGGLLVLVAIRRGVAGFWVFSAFLFLAPALLVGVQKMAWTPLAERYLYLPLFCLSLALFSVLENKRLLWQKCLAVLLLPMAVISVQRTYVWQSNLTLFADVAAKSPRFAPGLNEYASALFRAGRVEEARKYYQRAYEIGKGRARQIAQANLAKLFPGQKKTGPPADLPQLAESVKSPRLQRSLLLSLIRQVDKELIDAKDPKRKHELLEKSLILQRQLLKVAPDPFGHYRIGQLLLALERRDEAGPEFEKACQTSDDYYTTAACTLAQKLMKDASLSSE